MSKCFHTCPTTSGAISRWLPERAPKQPQERSPGGAVPANASLSSQPPPPPPPRPQGLQPVPHQPLQRRGDQRPGDHEPSLRRRQAEERRLRGHAPVQPAQTGEPPGGIEVSSSFKFIGQTKAGLGLKQHFKGLNCKYKERKGQTTAQRFLSWVK